MSFWSPARGPLAPAAQDDERRYPGLVGICSFGAYIPWWRLGAETKDWGSKAERSVASFDEDSITMAVAAATNCLAGINRKSVDGLYFASTTSPYKEKQVAATIAATVDLKPSVSTADFTNSSRAATTAVKAALDTQYPPQRVCTRCHTKDKLTPARFSGRKGEVYTYSIYRGGGAF